MKKLKKLLTKTSGALFLCSALLSPIPASAGTPVGNFSDVLRSSKNFHAIEYILDKGIISGYSDGTFRPDNTINRAELTKILLEAAGIEVATPKTNCFSDVPTDQWYAKYVCTAKNLGIVSGYSDGTFKPSQSVAKVEAIKILAGVNNFNLNETSSYTPGFTDIDTSAWYMPYVRYTDRKNILEENGNKFGPGDALTRAGIAEYVYRIAVMNQNEWSEYRELFSSETDNGVPAQPVNLNTPTTITENSNKKDWTFMVYLNGDNNLEPFALADFNELEAVGSGDNVNFITQIDRINGEDDSNGNWTGTRRYFIERDNDLEKINSKLIEDLGEVDMTDPAELTEFVNWGIESFPAKHYALIMWDHGGGWTGMSNDDTDDTYGMSIPEFGQALAALKAAGAPKFDLIGFDMCLMSQLEVYHLLQNYAEYAVASEETEAGDGWPYTPIATYLVNNPTANGEQLSRKIVDEYANYYSTSYSDPTHTLAAINLSQINGVTSAISNFAEAIDSALPKEKIILATAGRSAEGYGKDGIEDWFYYRDLEQIANIVSSRTTNSSIQTAGEDLVNAIAKAVVTTKSGGGHPNSNGISIYLPPVGEYNGSYDDLLFAQDSSWNGEFLNALTNTVRDNLRTPSIRGLNLSGQRSGGSLMAALSSLFATATTYSLDEGLDVDFALAGDVASVGYALGYYDDSTEEYVWVDYTEIIDETDSVGTPVWNEGDTVSFTVNPEVWAITNGTDSIYAPLFPSYPGAMTYEGQVSYSAVYGELSGSAVFDFNQGGALTQITAKDENGAVRSYIPREGEKITLYQMATNARGDKTYYPTDLLEYGSDGIYYEPTSLPNGDYVVMILLEGADGTLTQELINATVSDADSGSVDYDYAALDDYSDFDFADYYDDYSWDYDYADYDFVDEEWYDDWYDSFDQYGWDENSYYNYDYDYSDYYYDDYSAADWADWNYWDDSTYYYDVNWDATDTDMSEYLYCDEYGCYYYFTDYYCDTNFTCWSYDDADDYYTSDFDTNSWDDWTGEEFYPCDYYGPCSVEDPRYIVDVDGDEWWLDSDGIWVLSDSSYDTFYPCDYYGPCSLEEDDHIVDVDGDEWNFVDGSWELADYDGWYEDWYPCDDYGPCSLEEDGYVIDVDGDAWFYTDGYWYLESSSYYSDWYPCDDYGPCSLETDDQVVDVDGDTWNYIDDSWVLDWDYEDDYNSDYDYNSNYNYNYNYSYGSTDIWNPCDSYGPCSLETDTQIIDADGDTWTLDTELNEWVLSD